MLIISCPNLGFQYYGFILYRHKLKVSVKNASLITDGVRDRGYVMVDQVSAHSTFFIIIATSAVSELLPDGELLH